MRKFEYKISMNTWYYLPQALEKKGLEGWELVSANRNREDVTCIFKRELVDFKE